MSDQLLLQFDELLARRLGTIEESINGKLELLAEGQQMIVERMDRIEGRVETVERIVTEHSGQLLGLAADLTAHRRDTEAHGRGYLVSEN